MKNKGNVLLVFIMLVGLSMIIFTVISMISMRIRESGINTADSQAFYLAEAGLNKAVWYLGTPSGQGGKGSDWRGAVIEAFGDGTYSVTVINTAVTSRVLMISTGEAKGSRKTVRQITAMESYPEAFDYSIFCGNSNLNVTGSSVINGDMYVNGNTSFVGDASLGNGEVYHAGGYAVTGNATDGGPLEPPPSMPNFSTTSYDENITAAEAVAPGNVTYTNLTLTGNTIYVNGNVTISGTGTITGTGTIVATGNILIPGSPTGVNSQVTFISKGTTDLSGSANLPQSTFYSRDSIKVTGNTDLQLGSLITSGNLEFTGNMQFSGMAYCAGEAKISGDINFEGSLVTNSFKHISGNPTITYNAEALPADIPPGFTGGDPSLLKGTWKEI